MNKAPHEYKYDEVIPTIPASVCTKCGYAVFSRANHDFRWCPCQSIAVDGGFSSYGGRGVFTDEPPGVLDIPLNLTRRQLYDDWNTKTDQFGLVKLTKKQLDTVLDELLNEIKTLEKDSDLQNT